MIYKWNLMGQGRMPWSLGGGTWRPISCTVLFPISPLGWATKNPLVPWIPRSPPSGVMVCTQLLPLGYSFLPSWCLAQNCWRKVLYFILPSVLDGLFVWYKRVKFDHESCCISGQGKEAFIPTMSASAMAHKASNLVGVFTHPFPRYQVLDIEVLISFSTHLLRVRVHAHRNRKLDSPTPCGACIIIL
jgi:hypothetical protein